MMVFHLPLLVFHLCPYFSFRWRWFSTFTVDWDSLKFTWTLGLLPFPSSFPVFLGSFTFCSSPVLFVPISKLVSSLRTSNFPWPIRVWITKSLLWSCFPICRYFHFYSCQICGSSWNHHPRTESLRDFCWDLWFSNVFRGSSSFLRRHHPRIKGLRRLCSAAISLLVGP